MFQVRTKGLHEGIHSRSTDGSVMTKLSAEYPLGTCDQRPDYLGSQTLPEVCGVDAIRNDISASWNSV